MQPSAGTRIAESIGKGLTTGIQGALEARLAGMKEAEKQKQQLQLIDEMRKRGMFGNAPSTESDAELETGVEPTVAQMPQEGTDTATRMAIATLSPAAANALEHEEKMKIKQKELALGESKDYRKKIEEVSSSLPDKRIALFRIEDALKNNDLSSIQNFFADLAESKGLPGDYLRTSSSAALQSGVKEFLLGDIARIKGGRPNQFIEKQLASAYPQAGYDKTANMKILKAMKTGTEIAQKEIEIYERISDEYEARGKPVPGNISKLVNKELKKYVTEKEDELQEYYQRLNNPKGKKVTITAPDGTSRTGIYSQEVLKKAKKLGGKITIIEK